LTDELARRLRAEPWDRRQAADGDARTVPDALLALAAATDPDEIRRIYWRLDNHVVVQGSVYEAAYHLLPYLLELLTDRDRASRIALYDLLVEIAAGQPANAGATVVTSDGSQLDLGEACQARIRDDGMATVVDDLVADGTHPAVRDRALHVLMAVETRPDELAGVLDRIPDPGSGRFSAKLRAARNRPRN
jgi:hypothetical protein